MSDWKSFYVEQLGKIITGKTPKTSNVEYYGGDIPFLTPSDDMSVKHVIETKRSLSDLGKSTVKNLCLPKNSVCVSCIGSDLGKVVITGRETVSNQQINSIIVDEKFFDVDFVYYSMVILGKKLKYLSHTSTAVPIINKSTFSKFTISCPPLETQKKIAAVLSALDDKIELNNAINKNLEEQAQAIYKNMFVDNFNPAWKRGTIENLSQNIVCGKTPSTKCAEYYGGNIPFITIPDMHNMVYVVDTERYLSSIGAISQSNKFLPVNSICVSCIGTAGLVSLTSRDSQTNQQINSIIPKKKISPYYVYYLMKSLCEKIIKLGSCGSTIVNLNKGQFSRIEVTIPPDDVMYLFNERVTFIFKMILSNIQENQKLGELRDALLPRLMSGEIDVSAVEI